MFGFLRPRCASGVRPARRSRPAVEALEDRALPAVTLAGGIVTITGSAQADDADVFTTTTSGTDTAFDDKLIVMTRIEDGPWQTYEFGLYKQVGGAYQECVNQIEFYGGDGDDYFIDETAILTFAHGQKGLDSLWGGQGVDHLFGGTGADWLNGGSGTDFLRGGANADRLEGGLGSDQLDGQGGDDTLYGEVHYLAPDSQQGSRDTLWGGSGFNELYGQGGNDVLHRGDDGNDLFGGAGDDWMKGGADPDWMEGGLGSDRLYGYGGSDKQWGDRAEDLDEGDPLMGSNDVLVGGQGYNWIYGQGGNDTLYGGHSGNSMHGGVGHDVLLGGDLDDILRGGEGSDWLSGQGGNDTLYGNEEWYLDDGAADALVGGTGTDTFHLGANEGDTSTS